MSTFVGLFDFQTECWKSVFAAAYGRKFEVEIAEVHATLQHVTDTHQKLSPKEPGRNIPSLRTYGSIIYGFSVLLSMASSFLWKNTDFMYKVYTLGQKVNLQQKDSTKTTEEAIPLAENKGGDVHDNGAGAAEVGNVPAINDLQRPPDACDHAAQELAALSAIKKAQDELAHAISQSIPVINDEDADFAFGHVQHTIEAENDGLFSQLLTNTANDMDVVDSLGLAGNCNLDGLRKEASEADGQSNSEERRQEGSEVDESPFSVHYAACLTDDAQNEHVDDDPLQNSVAADEESPMVDNEAPLVEVQVDRDQLDAALVQRQRLTKKYFDEAKSVRNVRVKTNGFVNIDRIEFDIRNEIFDDYRSVARWSSKIYDDAFDLSKMDEDDLLLMNMLPFGQEAQKECMDEWYVPRHEADPVFQRNPKAYISEEMSGCEDPSTYTYTNSLDDQNMDPDDQNMDPDDQNMDPNDYVAPMEVPFEQSPESPEKPVVQSQDDRGAERARWDEKMKHHGVFSELAPKRTTSKIAASRAFLHVLSRASQGIISLHQDYVYADIHYHAQPNATYKLTELVGGSEPSCASHSGTARTFTPA